MQLKKIVAATDFSEASLVALETALSLKLDPDSTIYFLHVVEEVTTLGPMGALTSAMEEIRRNAQRQLEATTPQNTDPAVRIERVVIDGSSARSISEFARSVNADLIVVGTHGRSGLSRMLMGSTAEAVLREAPCQVLVAKHKEQSGAEVKTGTG